MMGIMIKIVMKIILMIMMRNIMPVSTRGYHAEAEVVGGD